MPAVARYCVGFARAGYLGDGKIILVRKLKPEWQRGLLNGVGGRIEAGEHPLAAMRREWAEETKLRPVDWRLFAVLKINGEAKVNFFCGDLDSQDHGLGRLNKKNDVGEKLEALYIHEIVARSDTISNLKWLLPLAFLDRGKPKVTALEAA